MKNLGLSRFKRLISLTIFLAIFFLVFGTIQIVQAQPAINCGSNLLGSSQTGDLFSVNISTGAAALIGVMPGPLATEIEYDIANNILYAEETNGSLNLHTIDPTTGGSLGFVTHPCCALNGLEFVGTTLYGTNIMAGLGPSDLVIVDPTTGNFTTVIGPTGLGPVSGLAYDATNAIMYGITAGGAPADLVTINLGTGAATVVGPTGLDRIGSIEFGPDGNLYGGVTSTGSTFPSNLVRINTATGVATPVGNTGFSITGLTACASAPTAPTSVPTLNGWGMMIFMVLAGFISVYYLYARRIDIKA